MCRYYLVNEDGSALPKLVKQWRKMDFLDQPFVMSAMGNPPTKQDNDVDAPEEDVSHWPLIMNVSCEGLEMIVYMCIVISSLRTPENCN